MADHDLNIIVRAKGALQAARDIGRVDSSVGKLGRTASRGVATAAGNVARVGVVAAAGIGIAVHRGLESLAELESATTAVDGAIAQMGLTGQVTGAQVAGWANEIERSIDAAFDDKEITAAAATLLRFGKTAPGNLRPALQVTADLATKTGSVESAASILAKALADPTKAAGKLARSGVVLTKTQQEQIKAFVKAGKTAEAQKVILDALTVSTAGAAKASAGPYADSLNILQDVTEDAQRALAEGFLPVIMEVRDLLSDELAKPQTLNNIREFGRTLAGGLRSLVGIARNLPWDTIGNSLRIAGAGAKAVLDAFVGLPPWIQTAVLTGWGLNKLSGGALGSIVGTLASGLIKGVLGMTAGVVNINAATVNGMPGAGGGGGGSGLLGLLGIGIPAAGAAIGAKAIADFTNAEFTNAGFKSTDFVAPGAGDPFGISSAIHNIQEVVKLLGQRPRATEGSLDRPGSVGPAAEAQRAATERVQTAVETMKGNIAAELQTGQAATKAAGDVTATAATGAGRVAAAAALTAGYGVQAAIRASRPMISVNVTNNVTAAKVQSGVTMQERWGPGNGSAGGGGSWMDEGKGGGG